MAHQEPSHQYIEHAPPPIFYCWKYWLTTGEVREGCTPVNPNSNMLDLNDYGWAYMAIPVVGLFVLVFLFYCVCRGKTKQKVPKQPLISEVSESEEEEDYRARGRSYRAVPVRSANAKDFYTVVPIEGKVPLNGNADSRPQQRIYPRLTTMRHQVGINGKPVRGKGNSQSQPKSPEEFLPSNDYQPDPTAKPVENSRSRQPSSSEEEQ